MRQRDPIPLGATSEHCGVCPPKWKSLWVAGEIVIREGTCLTCSQYEFDIQHPIWSSEHHLIPKCRARSNLWLPGVTPKIEIKYKFLCCYLFLLEIEPRTSSMPCIHSSMFTGFISECFCCWYQERWYSWTMWYQGLNVGLPTWQACTLP